MKNHIVAWLHKQLPVFLGGSICFLILFYSGEALSIDDKLVSDNAKITFSVKNKKLEEVIKDISRQTGYNVKIREKWQTLPVSGVFSNITIEDFFRRIFREENISIISDDKNKIIIVRAFGDKIRGNKSDVTFNNVKKNNTISKLSFRGLSEQEEKNQADFENILKNPETIDPVTGLTLSALQEKERKNKADFENKIMDLQAVDPLTGLTLYALQDKEKKNRINLDTKTKNQSTLDPLTGLPLSALQDQEVKNNLDFEKMVNNPETVDPVTGLTLSTLREQEKKNKIEFNKMINK